MKITDLLEDPELLTRLAASRLLAPPGRVLAITFQDNAYDRLDGIRRLRREIGEVGMFFPIRFNHAAFGIKVIKLHDGRPESPILLASHGAGRDITDPARLAGIEIDDTVYRVVSLEEDAVEAILLIPEA